MDTAACAAYSAFERLNPVTDLYLVDLKGIEETACREKTGADLKLVLENIRKLTDAGKTVELRIPVIPGYSDTAEYMGACSGSDRSASCRKRYAASVSQAGRAEVPRARSGI